MEFDRDAIKKAGLSLITPVIVTNSADYTQVVPENEHQQIVNETVIFQIN